MTSLMEDNDNAVDGFAQMTSKKRAREPSPPPTRKVARVEEEDEPLAIVDVDDDDDDDDEGESRRLSFVLGETQDREMVVTKDGVTITSSTEPKKTIHFTLNRWAHLVAMKGRLDDEVKELNCKTRPVSFRETLGDGYYASVTSGVMCADFRKYYVPYGLDVSNIRPSKNGLALRIDEWANLMQLIPAIHADFPELAEAHRCLDDHNAKLDWLTCASCFPFGDRYAGTPPPAWRDRLTSLFERLF